MTAGAAVGRESVTIDGAELAFYHRRAVSAAQREPVVLLHPWFGCPQFWRHTVDALPECDTYAVDLYSLGANDDWQRFAHPNGLARAVVALLDSLGIERCSVIGNSMGGIAAQALAASQRERISKLILVGTGARIAGVKPQFRRALDDWIAGDANRAFTEQLVDSLLARRPPNPAEFQIFVDMVSQAKKAFVGAVLTAAFDLDLRPVLPSITASTLVIRGELDAARTRAHVEDLVAGIPHCTAVEIAAAGHSPQVDSPPMFCKLVRDFLLAL